MKISAELMPLPGKYYGSEIKLTNEKGDEAFFSVWVNGISDYKPSSRELATLEEGEEYEICDDHYETQAALHICRTIVAALDNLEV